MKLAVVLLVFSIFCVQCFTPKQYSTSRTSISFKDVELKLVQGKIDDTVNVFRSQFEQSFIVKFDQKKFRSFDGRFKIKGTAADKSSVPLEDFLHATEKIHTTAIR